MMWSLILLCISFTYVQAQTCNPANNDPVTELNYDGCNNAGTCIGGRRPRCVCCNKSDPNNWCAQNPNAEVPYLFTGSDCTTATFKYAVTFGWRYESSGTPDLICQDSLTDPPGTGGRGTQTTPDLNLQINAALQGLGYKGLTFAAACQTCRPDNPCDFSDTGAVTEGMTAGFATELNSYYDPACADFQIDTPTDCPANTDLGVEAYTAFITARGDTDSPSMQLTTTINAITAGVAPGCGALPAGVCLSWTSTTATVYVQKDLDSQRENFIITTDPPTSNPTANPTDPTPMPTGIPEPWVESKCFKYINRVLDHQFMGSAENCRAGIDDRWPGGKTCESPYVVCLPEENTPANPDPTEVPNISQTLPATAYSVNECAQECAFDQRCLGFELRPEAGSNTGECLLIDDIPIELTNEGTWPTGDSEAHVRSGLAVTTPRAGVAGSCSCGTPLTGETEDSCKQKALGDMDVNYYSFSSVGGVCYLCVTCAGFVANPLFASYQITGRLELENPANYDMIAPSKALCFAKMDYCNPYFEAEDLNAEMLECYCPNNRKGFYTKKVKRTVANTKYCGTDDTGDINTRIKKAQANRMFHLCENWCLFETGNPMTESWYWNPWHKCWREQYAGIGTHRSYCNRVIRDPMTIEQQFINNRSDNFCKKDPDTNNIIQRVTEEPTGAPSTMGATSWTLAGEEESCDDVCLLVGIGCDEGLTNSLVTGKEAEMNTAYEEASGGTSCTKTITGQKGWALPATYSDGTCVLRHPDTEYTGCNWAVGVGYQRLCACILLGR